VFEPPYIGASFASVTPDIAEALGLERATGALVADVTEAWPLRAMPDCVWATSCIGFNGQPIEHPDALGYRLATAGVGSQRGAFRVEPRWPQDGDGQA
jgi:S1-C subfamily serine protease